MATTGSRWRARGAAPATRRYQRSRSAASTEIWTAGYVPVAGDWDGDADVGVYNASTGVWSILLSNGNFTTSLSKNWGGAGYVPVPSFP
jgi:hypothetical protein